MNGTGSEMERERRQMMVDTEEAGAESRAVEIKILGSEGCANTLPTVELVKNVAQDLNIPINIEMVIVGTQEQARELLFLGSPTVRVGGCDIEETARDSLAFGLT